MVETPAGSYTGADAAVAVAERGVHAWREAKLAWLNAFAALRADEAASATRPPRAERLEPPMAYAHRLALERARGELLAEDLVNELECGRLISPRPGRLAPISSTATPSRPAARRV